jgi:hypothetical protein
MWTGRNTGSAFQFLQTSTLAPAAGWSIVAGEFAGNSRFDVAAYHPSDGSVWVAASPSPPGPDLMVRRFEVTGIARVNADESLTVPVRITVRNQGDAVAGSSNTWVSLFGSSGTILLGLRVPGQTDRYNTPSLAPQAEVSLSGTVRIASPYWRFESALVAIADACRGEALARCLIRETNEDNASNPVTSLEIPYVP